MFPKRKHRGALGGLYLFTTTIPTMTIATMALSPITMHNSTMNALTTTTTGATDIAFVSTKWIASIATHTYPGGGSGTWYGTNAF